MYCKKCGTMLDDNARFCFGCGAQVNDEAPAGKPAAQPRYAAPVTSKKAPKKKKGLAAVVAIVAVIAVAVAALAFSGLLGSDLAKASAALTKSGKAFTDAYNQMGLTDVSALVESKQTSEELSLWIDEVDGTSSMSGLGVRLSLDSNLPERNADMALTPFWGSADLLTLQMKLNDAELYLGSPEMTGGNFYMINTETFCSDLENMGADLGEAADLSFNIFDLIERIQEMNAGNEELTKAVKEAATALVKEVEVTKAESKERDVHDAILKCTVYDVAIPEAALHTFLNAVEDAYRSAESTVTFGQLLESMGFPAEIVDEMEYTFDESSSSVYEGFSVLHEVLEELGDIHLNLYVNDGYVVSVIYDKNINGVDVAMILNIGGGDNYVDNISLRLIADDEEYRITSTGNHAGTNNVFTDVTVLEYVYGDETTTLIEMDTTYASKQTEDNFSFQLKADSAALELSGQLTFDKEYMNLYLDEIAVSEYGEILAVVGMEFSIGKYEGESFTVGSYQAFADMSESDLMNAGEEISKNVTSWAMNLDSDIQSKLLGIASDLF